MTTRKFESEFKHLIDVPHLLGVERERNLELILGWFHWSITNSNKRVHETLAAEFDLTTARVSKIIDDFKKKMRGYKLDKEKKTGLLSTIDAIQRVLETYEYFVLHDNLAKELVHVGLTANPLLFECIQDIAILLGRPIPVEVATIDNITYILPKNINKKSVEQIQRSARGAAQKYGGVFPYDVFMDSKVCAALPGNRRDLFVHILLESNSDHLVLGNGKYFAFKKEQERLVTQLQKVFYIYDEVPVQNLIDAICRPIRKALISKGDDPSILDRCAMVLDEYCLETGIYQRKSISSRMPSLRLKERIEQNPPAGKLFNDEVKVAKALRANAKPMTTKEFIALIDRERITTQKSYLMEFSVLFYRTGGQKHSEYHSLDDGNNTPGFQPIVEADLDAITQEESLEEGFIKQCLSNYYERNPKLRFAAIKFHGTKCVVCGFDFGKTYGEHGAGYIEVHHLIPISSLKEKMLVNPKTDMAVVCSNCHRMIHRKKEKALSIEELRALFNIPKE